MFVLVSAAFLLCLTVHYTHSAVINNCPNDWVNFDDFCYAFPDDIVPWSTAKEVCRDLEASLLVITNNRENDFIAAQLRARHGTSGNNWYWINIHDFVREGHWVQGDNQPLAFTRWAAGEPSNHIFQGNGEDCASILSDGAWVDLQCGNYIGGSVTSRPVCKKRKMVSGL